MVENYFGLSIFDLNIYPDNYRKIYFCFIFHGLALKLSKNKLYSTFQFLGLGIRCLNYLLAVKW